MFRRALGSKGTVLKTTHHNPSVESKTNYTGCHNQQVLIKHLNIFKNVHASTTLSLNFLSVLAKP